MGVLAVVAWAQLLRFDVEPMLAHLSGGRGGRGHGALAAPCRTVDACVAVRRSVRADGCRRLV